MTSSQPKGSIIYNKTSDHYPSKTDAKIVIVPKTLIRDKYGQNSHIDISQDRPQDITLNSLQIIHHKQTYYIKITKLPTISYRNV